jgi:hypothetical protein
VAVGVADHAGRRHSAARTNAILSYDLLEGRLENLPWKHLDILLDVAGFGVGEAHNNLEKLLAVRLGLGYGLRMESFQVATNTVLLLNAETGWCGNKLLEKIDSVDRCDIAFTLLSPPYARNADTVRWSVVDAYRLTGGVNGRSFLCLAEEDNPATIGPLL